MPLEILRMILEFMLPVKHLRNVALTCQALRPLATELLHKTIAINIGFNGFFIYQIESLLQPNRPGLKSIRNLRIQDRYNYDEDEYSHRINSDDIASF
ncbi:hypothetical protein TWF703_008256 [Orbilia oligospora]|nr:hypothetical protein TWF703_008256 [Orbilia oligospora]